MISTFKPIRGQIICNLGDHLKSELSTCLPIFLDRLRNEITRLTTVKALTLISGSPLEVDLSPILVSCVDALIGKFKEGQGIHLACTTLLKNQLVVRSRFLLSSLIHRSKVDLFPHTSEFGVEIIGFFF